MHYTTNTKESELEADTVINVDQVGEIGLH